MSSGIVVKPCQSKTRVEQQNSEEKKQNARSCGACYSDLLSNEGVSCSALAPNVKHLLCEPCFNVMCLHQASVEERGKLKQNGSRIMCTFCAPPLFSAFSEKEIALYLLDENLALFRRACNEIIEARAYEAAESLFNTRLADIRQDANTSAKAQKSAHHRLHIAENILTLKCPRCKIAFLDFSGGCLDLSCELCRCHFCAWCFADCGEDAHDHVKTCPQSTRPGIFGGNMDDFNKTHVTRRGQEVAAYLVSQAVAPDERDDVKRAIAIDLRDLGISDEIMKTTSVVIAKNKPSAGVLEEGKLSEVQLKDQRIARHRLHIAENILTLKCPSCHAAIFDFSGSFAISCTCRCALCAWCLADCGQDDAHLHVKTCPQNLNPSSFWGTTEEFNKTHAERRGHEVAAYLLSVAEDERDALKSAIATDLRDLGINL